MPDVWAGVGLVALATLLFFSDALGRLTIMALFLVVVAALSFHHSNAPVALLAALIAAPAAHLLWHIPWRRMALGLSLLIAAVTAAGALDAGYDLAVKASTGDTLRSPPFLAARILADGPGRAYLRRSCGAGATWALCRSKTCRWTILKTFCGRAIRQRGCLEGLVLMSVFASTVNRPGL